jgi:hypothetical protein
MKRSALIVASYSAVYAAAAAVLKPGDMLVLLNGMFVGAFASMLIVFRTLTLNTFLGRIDYPDVRVFTLGLLITLAGIVMGVLASIYNQATDAIGSVYTLAVMGRYAIVAGFLTMAYSPDTGLGFFEGTDRKAVAFSVLVGLAVAAFVVWIQAAEVLAL